MSFNFAKAQSSLIATLSHDDNVKVFYGASALKQAHSSAADGDIITLSPGTFNSPEITKAVTIRGAGVINDPDNGIEPTRIADNITINVLDSLNRLNIEGIYFKNRVYIHNNNTDLTFKKCWFETLMQVENTSSNNIFIINCRIKIFNILCRRAFVLNSIINISTSNSICKNCILSYASSIRNSSFENCIFFQNTKNEQVNLLAENVVKNCISNSRYTFNAVNGINSAFYDISNTFKTFSGNDITSSFSELFELTEEAKTTYLGTDGKEVGIHGGDFPFDETSDFPRIIKCNVAPKSTVDGKLNVEIQVTTGK